MSTRQPWEVSPVPRAPKVCSDPACPNLQPCATHSRKPWEGSTRRARLPKDWDRRRRTVLARDPFCRICDDAVSVEVDHIIPGDDHSLENLQGVCEPCHRKKSSAEAAEARRAYREDT